MLTHCLRDSYPDLMPRSLFTNVSSATALIALGEPGIGRSIARVAAIATSACLDRDPLHPSGTRDTAGPHASRRRPANPAARLLASRPPMANVAACGRRMRPRGKAMIARTLLLAALLLPAAAAQACINSIGTDHQGHSFSPDWIVGEELTEHMTEQVGRRWQMERAREVIAD